MDLQSLSGPLVSVLMAVRNEASSIQWSLEAVLKQDLPAGRMEVLVADGMSTDGTREIVTRIALQRPQVRLRLLDNPGRIAPTGLNAALRQSRGDVVVRVDGHTIIAPDYLRECVEALQQKGADNVGGRMNAVGKNAFGRIVALATRSWFGIGGGRFHISEAEEWVDTVYMGAWPRGVFEKIGLFDEELVRDQDDEFNYRLRQAGGRILLSPRIRSEYEVRGSPGALWSQYFAYGFWKVRVLQKHPRQMQVRQFVPPIFAATLMASLVLAGIAPLVRGAGTFWWVFLAPAGVYLVADLLVSLRLSAGKGVGQLLALPAVFAMLHLSYGMGFLAGLCRFWNRWGDRRGKTPEWHSEAVKSSETAAPAG